MRHVASNSFRSKSAYLFGLPTTVFKTELTFWVISASCNASNVSSCLTLLLLAVVTWTLGAMMGRSSVRDFDTKGIIWLTRAKLSILPRRSDFFSTTAVPGMRGKKRLACIWYNGRFWFRINWAFTLWILSNFQAKNAQLYLGGIGGGRGGGAIKSSLHWAT